MYPPLARSISLCTSNIFRRALTHRPIENIENCGFIVRLIYALVYCCLTEVFAAAKRARCVWEQIQRPLYPIRSVAWCVGVGVVNVCTSAWTDKAHVSRVYRVIWLWIQLTDWINGNNQRNSTSKARPPKHINIEIHTETASSCARALSTRGKVRLRWTMSQNLWQIGN